MLQPNQDKSKILYDAVSQDYDLGTFEEFQTKLKNPEKRKIFYESIGSEYDLGETYEDFESKLTNLLKKKDSSSSTSQKQKSESPGQEENTSSDLLVNQLSKGELDQRLKQLQNENLDSENKDDSNISDLLNRYKISTELNENDDLEIINKTQNEAEGNFGFIDKLKRAYSNLSISDPLLPTYTYT